MFKHKQYCEKRDLAKCVYIAVSFTETTYSLDCKPTLKVSAEKIRYCQYGIITHNLRLFVYLFIFRTNIDPTYI